MFDPESKETAWEILPVSFMQKEKLMMHDFIFVFLETVLRSCFEKLF